MSWIRVVPPDRADAELSAAYSDLVRERGRISNILQVHSLRPAAMRRHLDLYMDLMFAPGGLSRRQRELVAVVVSQQNSCGYCVAHHQEALARYVKDANFLAELARGETPAGLDEADSALVDYARRLTRQPQDMTEGDVEFLRARGFDDADVLLCNLIVAYFNFVNRIALGLGVQHDPEETAGYKDRE